MPVVLDGPMGTELARRGVQMPAGAWSAHALEVAPDIVAAIHREYGAAGATVHTTNTFRTTRRAIGSAWETLARRAARLTRASVPREHRVAGSIAPLEDCYRPDLSPAGDSRREHRALATVLADEGVDLLLCETFPNAIEAVVAVEEAARTGLETWVALTAGPLASLMTPAEMAHAARLCVEAGAHAVLVGCTPALRTLPFVERLAEIGVPTGAYANAGREDDAIGWSADPNEGARTYASLALGWVAAGASIVGGCCGTRPEHVAELARRLQRTSRTSTRP